MAKSRKKNKQKPAKPTVKAASRNSKKPPSFWHKHWLPAIVIALFATLPYWQTRSYEYVLDDKIVFTENQFVKEGLAGLGDIFGKESFAGYFGEQRDLVVGARYRPLSLATFALEFELWGQNHGLSHAINILIYALTGILLYAVFWFLLPGDPKRIWYFSLPFAATLLFVLHPIHSEVVANVKGRDEILALIGALGALLLSRRYVKSPHWKWLLGSGLIFLLAVLAKENALTFLAIIPLSLYFFSRASKRQLAAVTVPLVLASALYLLLRLSVIGYLLSPAGQEVTEVMNNPFYGMTSGERLATVFYTLGYYLKLLFFPHPLTHDYYPYQIPILNWGDWRAILSLTANLALLLLAIWAWRKRRVLSYGILFYFITLSIVSNLLFPVGTFLNERFVYMPSVGFALVLGWLIVDRLPAMIKRKGQTIALVLLGILSLAYLGRTWVRVPAWENMYTLNEAAIKYSPNSARANLFWGVAIYQGKFLKETDPQKKLSLLVEIDSFANKSVQIVPTYRSAQDFRAGLAGEHYKLTHELGPLLATFQEVAVFNPEASNLHAFLDWLAGRGDPSGEIAAFAHHTGYELLSQQQGQHQAAIRLLNYGLRVSPNNAQLRQDMGMVYRAMGDEAKARKYLE